VEKKLNNSERSVIVEAYRSTSRHRIAKYLSKEGILRIPEKGSRKPLAK
jgi:hypothetical protein